MDKTPNEYIRWRYQNGEDRELAAKITRQLTPEEEKRLENPIVIDGEKRKIETIMGRRNAKRGFEYEIKVLSFYLSLLACENVLMGA
jgi:elongation factor 3